MHLAIRSYKYCGIRNSLLKVTWNGVLLPRSKSPPLKKHWILKRVWWINTTWGITQMNLLFRPCNVCIEVCFLLINTFPTCVCLLSRKLMNWCSYVKTLIDWNFFYLCKRMNLNSRNILSTLLSRGIKQKLEVRNVHKIIHTVLNHWH